MKLVQSAVERAMAGGEEAWGSERQPRFLATAPGRIEVLGNHVDYSGGQVIAAAIDREVAIAVSPISNAGALEVAFTDFENDEVQVVDARQLNDWRNEFAPPEPLDYLRGTVSALKARGLLADDLGARISIAGDVPIGLGLSSSAALCVAMTCALATQLPGQRDIVLIAQEAEHRAGTPCGTMDQSASVAGGFILFDSTTVTFEALQPNLGDLVFAVADSGVSRSLGTSSYPVRVKESQQALAIAKAELGRDIGSLADVTIPDLSLLSGLSEERKPPILLSRLRHIVTENERVRTGHAAVIDGDWKAFGALMTESGRSSANDYEISHPRVEELVAEALKIKGVLGARMMGGGEGGTALILVHRSSIPELKSRLAERYYAKHDMAENVHVFQNAAGATVRSLD